MMRAKRLGLWMRVVSVRLLGPLGGLQWCTLPLRGKVGLANLGNGVTIVPSCHNPTCSGNSG